MEKGQTFQHEFKVDEKVYREFISLSGDKNPLHTDGTFAKEKGFMGVVMHGNILNCFLSYFVGECLPLKDVIIHSQEIKYMKPVYLNDELVLKVEVEGVFDSVNVVELKFVFEKKKDQVKVSKGKINIGIIS